MKQTPPGSRETRQTKYVSFRLQIDKLVALDAMARDSGTTRSALLQLAVDKILKTGLGADTLGGGKKRGT